MSLQEQIEALMDAAQEVVDREVGGAIEGSIVLARHLGTDAWTARVVDDANNAALVSGDASESPEEALASLAMELGVVAEMDQ